MVVNSDLQYQYVFVRDAKRRFAAICNIIHNNPILTEHMDGWGGGRGVETHVRNLRYARSSNVSPPPSLLYAVAPSKQTQIDRRTDGG